MDAVLPNGKFKVTGVIENTAWRERHEAQKKARIERMKDSKLRANYEARMQAKAQRKAEREAAQEARIQEIVREKMLAQTYKQLGIEEDYITKKQAMIDEARAKNPNNARTDALGKLETQEEVAIGAGRNAAADEKEIRGMGKDIAVTAGTAAIAAAGGIEAVGSKILGDALFGQVLKSIGLIANASFFGPIITIASIATLAHKIIKKAKVRKGNVADQAQKLDDYQEELDNFKKQLQTVESRLAADQQMMVEKYKSMKKGEFNTYLKGYIVQILAEAGLVSDSNAAHDAAKKIEEQIENEADKEEQDKNNAEEAKENKGEEKTEELDKEKNKPEEPKNEEMGSVPDISNDGLNETPMGNNEADALEEDLQEGTVEKISLEDIAAEKDKMIEEHLIENPTEKANQIKEEAIRRAQEEERKRVTENAHKNIEKEQ